MNRYIVGQIVRIGGVDRERGHASDIVNRVEVTRPDGTVVTKDWDLGALKIMVSEPGIWLWKAMVRDDGISREQDGQFEVVRS